MMNSGKQVSEVENWIKPVPLPDNVSGEYWSAAARGELLVQECTACGHRQFYGRALCTKCGGVPEWIVTDGRGVVHTFTIVRQHGMAAFREDVPYVLAMVELEEGPMLMGNVTDCEVNDVTIGMPVQVHFRKVQEQIGIPCWRPITPS